MTKQETAKLLAMNYSYYAKEETQQQIASANYVWFNTFKDYPFEVVHAALMEAFRYSKYFLHVADLQPYMPKENVAKAQWQQLRGVVPEVKKWEYCASIPLILGMTEDGKLIKTNGKKELQELFDTLPEAVRAYLGSVGGLLEFSHMSDEELERFESKRFFKEVPATSPRPALQTHAQAL